MLQDPDEPRWSSPELQYGLDILFPRSLDTVQDIIEEIRSTLHALQTELACFDEIVWMGAKVNQEMFAKQLFSLRPWSFHMVTCIPNHHVQNEPMKDTVRRVRKKVKITWNKTNFEQQVKSLRELNDDLRCFREQAAEIKQPVIRSTACIRLLSQEYGSIGKVRRVLKAFHQALVVAWVKDISKTQPEETRYYVKLKLDTQVRDEVKMEVVIVCYGHSRLQP